MFFNAQSTACAEHSKAIGTNMSTTTTTKQNMLFWGGGGGGGLEGDSSVGRASDWNARHNIADAGLSRGPERQGIFFSPES